MSETTKKRSRSKKVGITGASVVVNGVIYGVSAMQTEYTTSMPLPSKDKVQVALTDCYMKLLRLFTEGTKEKDAETSEDPLIEESV